MEGNSSNPGNQNWTLQLNLAGSSEFDPTSFARLPTGPYEVKILDAVQKPAKEAGKADTIEFDLQVTEAGQHAGMNQKIWMSMDLSKGPTSVQAKHWYNLLSSVASNPDSLKKTVNLARQHVIGKTAFIYVAAAAEEEAVIDPITGKKKTPFDNRNFITKTQYLRFKEQGTAAGATATGAQRSAPAAALNGGTGAAIPQPSAAEGVI